MRLSRVVVFFPGIFLSLSIVIFFFISLRRKFAASLGSHAMASFFRVFFSPAALAAVALALISALSLFFPGCEAKIADFDAHYKLWAKQKASRIGRSLSWADAYGKQRHLAERPQYR